MFQAHFYFPCPALSFTSFQEGLLHFTGERCLEAKIEILGGVMARLVIDVRPWQGTKLGSKRVFTNQSMHAPKSSLLCLSSYVS